MAHNRSSSVTDLKALFETSASKKRERKPMKKVKGRRHSMSKMWEDRIAECKTKPTEVTTGPKKQYREWDAVNDEQKMNMTENVIPGKLTHDWGKQKTDDIAPINRPTRKIIDCQYNTGKTITIKPQINKLVFATAKTEILNECLRKKLGKQSTNIEEKQIESNEEMMTCAPDCVVPPQSPQQPKQNARAYFSDQLIGPKWAIPYDTAGSWSGYSDYVGEGSYPINKEAFPNASRGTFDAIAIDANTRVILWEKENFEGKVLLDVIGPKLINNLQFKTSYSCLITDKFQDAEVEKNYPQSVRVWSETNMQLWTTGSVKIVAANS